MYYFKKPFLLKFKLCYSEYEKKFLNLRKTYFLRGHLYENIFTNLWCDNKVLFRSIFKQLHKQFHEFPFINFIHTLQIIGITHQSLIMSIKFKKFNYKPD